MSVAAERARLVALGPLVAGLLAPAALGAATSEPALALTARTPHIGWITLTVSGGSPGSLVSVRERDRVVAQLRLDDRGRALAPHALPWRCDRQVRELQAAGSTTSVTTPSCERRLLLRTTPRRPRAGLPLAVRVIDRWRLGRLGVRVCLAPVAGRPRCAPAHLESRGARVRFRAPRPGRWAVEARAPGVALSRPLQILPSGGRLSVLAIGDSLIEHVASNLTRLVPQTVQMHTDMLYGVGISKPAPFNWIAHSRRVEARLRPDVVVVFIGGNEGASFGPVECCGRAWIAEFERRVRSVMRDFGRRGAAQVYWLALPAPRPAGHRETWTAENVAFPRAARHLDPWTQVLDMSAIFTPGFVYRDEMPVDGQMTTVRESDGIHLNDIGGEVAARAILERMRTDGVIATS